MGATEGQFQQQAVQLTSSTVHTASFSTSRFPKFGGFRMPMSPSRATGITFMFILLEIAVAVLLKCSPPCAV